MTDLTFNAYESQGPIPEVFGTVTMPWPFGAKHLEGTGWPPDPPIGNGQDPDPGLSTHFGENGVQADRVISDLSCETGDYGDHGPYAGHIEPEANGGDATYAEDFAAYSRRCEAEGLFTDKNQSGNGHGGGKRASALVPYKAEAQDVVILPERGTAYIFPEEKEIKPREWLFDRHYVRGVPTGTFAPGGFCKTANSVREMIAMSLTGLRVWFISGEDPMVELDRRIAAYCKHNAVDRIAVAKNLFVDDRKSYPIIFAKEGRNQSVIFSEDHLRSFENRIVNNGIDVTICDPFISFHEGQETNTFLDRLVKRLAEICERRNKNIELNHHTRKLAFGQGVTIDDARGGGALVDALRSCRLINRMTEKEGELAEINKDERFRYLRIDTGKRNMAPPELAKWIRLVSVDLDNGDNVQVAELWSFPKTFDAVCMGDQDWIRNLASRGTYRADSRSPEWLGLELAKKYNRNPKIKGDVVWINKVLSAWVENGVLKKTPKSDDNRRERIFFERGEGAQLAGNDDEVDDL